MKVVEKTTHAVLESDNRFIIEQWKKFPDLYTPIKPAPAPAQNAAAPVQNATAQPNAATALNTPSTAPETPNV